MHLLYGPEAESKEKHGAWDPLPELTITLPYVHSRVDSNTFTMGNPMPESTLSSSQGLWIWPLNIETLLILWLPPLIMNSLTTMENYVKIKVIFKVCISGIINILPE
jgi:hypothetical protein